jgi:hypothetical protein
MRIKDSLSVCGLLDKKSGRHNEVVFIKENKDEEIIRNDNSTVGVLAGFSGADCLV